MSPPNHMRMDVLRRTSRRPSWAYPFPRGCGAPSAARSSGAVTLRVAAPMSFQRDSCERLALTASTAAMTFSSSATQRSALCAVSPSCSAIAKTSVR